VLLLLLKNLILGKITISERAIGVPYEKAFKMRGYIFFKLSPQFLTRFATGKFVSKSFKRLRNQLRAENKKAFRREPRAGQRK